MFLRRIVEASSLQEKVEHVAGGIGRRSRLEDARNVRDVVADGDQSIFLVARASALPQPDVGQQGITQALASHRIFACAALAQVIVDWLRWAAIAQRAVRTVVERA